MLKIYTDDEVMQLMDTIEYGYIDRNCHKHFDIDSKFAKLYILQRQNEVKKNKIGVCWDQVELERCCFKNNKELKIKTYFIVYYDKKQCPTHTFLTYEKGGNFYWFEHSWAKYKGVYKYNTLKELLVDVRRKFIASEIKTDFKKENLVVFEYAKPKQHLNVEAFYKHCESGKIIDIDNL